ncbi:MAG: glycosyltransferase family 4 protein [Gemmataceae bacterium]|nr:glycosyltransferase family 4 protein [Gemmataceae bacterium]
MRIAHFIQRYPPALGGSEAYFARLSRFLVGKGDRVSVFTSTAVALAAFWGRSPQTVSGGVTVEDGVEVRRYGLVRGIGRRFVLKPLSLIPHRLWQCLTLPCNPICPGMWRDAGRADLAFDMVHAAAFPYAWPIACARRLARRLRVPFLITPFLHLGDPADPKDATRRGYLSPPLAWLLREADGVFVQTPSEQDAVLGLGIPVGKVVLQGLGVDPAECTGGDRMAFRQTMNIDDGDVVIGHLANQSREKGTVDLLQALELLWQRGNTAHVALAGPEMPNFRAFWTGFEQRIRPEWRSRIHRQGVLDDRHKRDFFAGIDVFALPSRSDSFGLVLLEAWANGKPVAAYRAGGIADLVRHGRDGLLAPCGNIAALAAALASLCESAEPRSAFGEHGRSRLASEFHWPDKLEVVRATYRRLIERRCR